MTQSLALDEEETDGRQVQDLPPTPMEPVAAAQTTSADRLGVPDVCQIAGQKPPKGAPRPAAVADPDPHRRLANHLAHNPQRLPCMAGSPLSDDPDARNHVADVLCPPCPVLELCREAGQSESWGVWGGVDRTGCHTRPTRRPTRRTGRPTAGERRTRTPAAPKPCRIDGCGKTGTNGQSICPMHQSRIRRHGDPHTATRRPERPAEARRQVKA